MVLHGEYTPSCVCHVSVTNCRMLRDMSMVRFSVA